MLTNNFYKLLTADCECHIRQYSPSSSANNTSPFVDLINPSGKYICYRAPESADTNKYEQINLPYSSFYANGSMYYALGVATSNYTDTKKWITSSSGNTRTIVHDTSAFTSSKNVNEQVSTQEAYPDGGGSLIMYIGNGTTSPTKDDYTMSHA